MSQCTGQPATVLHPALERRFSPAFFRDDMDMTHDQIDILLDAARFAPSAGNSQPWRFIVGLRGDAIHGEIIRNLARSSSVWAPGASALIVNLVQVGVEGAPEWEHSEFARYDLGQAVAHMTLQGMAMGLDSHQFRAFDRPAIERAFRLPAHWEAMSMTAFGVAGHERGLVTTPGTQRDRRSRDEITWARG